MDSPFDPTAPIIGATGEAHLSVTDADTATAFRSGDLPVLATPRMIALMEEAACAALVGRLPRAATTVGTHLDVRHVAPSPVGADVIAHAEVVDATGTRLTFAVRAEHVRDGQVTQIGSGTHVRVIVDRAEFVGRL